MCCFSYNPVVVRTGWSDEVPFEVFTGLFFSSWNDGCRNGDGGGNGNALTSTPCFDSTESAELDVVGRLVEPLLLKVAEALRSALAMLDRLWRSVDNDFLVCSTVVGDGTFEDSGSLATIGKEKVRLAFTPFRGDVVVGVGGDISSLITGRSTLHELATLKLRGKTSYVGT